MTPAYQSHCSFSCFPVPNSAQLQACSVGSLLVSTLLDCSKGQHWRQVGGLSLWLNLTAAGRIACQSPDGPCRTAMAPLQQIACVTPRSAQPAGAVDYHRM